MKNENTNECKIKTILFIFLEKNNINYYLEKIIITI